MNYSISISGMHCSGCQSLIALSLEELEFTNINVDLIKNEATFSTADTFDNINKKLIILFIFD